MVLIVLSKKKETEFMGYFFKNNLIGFISIDVRKK